MTTATLSGRRVTHAKVYLPAWGVWHAEVSIDEEAELTGSVSLVVADLSLDGTVLSGGPSKGRSHYRIAGGAGGWGKTIPATSYANDAGVKLSTVLGDAARLAGETLDTSSFTDSRIGPAFVRESAPAARVLQHFAPQGWYVSEDGTTRIGARPAADLSATVTLGPVDLAQGTVTIASDTIATIVPGIRAGGLQAVDVLHEVSPDGGLRSTIWGTGIASTSRRVEAFRRMLGQLLPDYRFRGVSEYRVVTIEGERINLQPCRVSLGMPDLRRVHVRPGVPGVRADVALGSRVLVTFVDGDRSRPVVVGFEEPEGDGFSPSRLDLSAVDDLWTSFTEGGRVVRYGDYIAFPVSAAPTQTAMPVTAVAVVPAPPFTVSRVRA